MKSNTLPLLILLTTLLSITYFTTAALRCPDCGQTPVPYPLSTGPRCGDQSYKIWCNKGALWFGGLNHSSYMITSINPSTRRLIVRLPGYASQNACISADIRSQGMWLDEDLPFNITTSNTVIKLNCSMEMLQFDLSCVSSNKCQTYIRENREAYAACGMGGTSMICCMYRAGFSILAYRIRASFERCTMYQSFVHLDPKLPVSKWPEPGVEIQWAKPLEPGCKSAPDCRNLENSSCLKDPSKDGERRCFCNEGFLWDLMNGVCQKVTCKKHCKLRKIFEGFGLVILIFLAGGLIVFIVRKRRQNIPIGAHVRLKKAQDNPNFQQQCYGDHAR